MKQLITLMIAAVALLLPVASVAQNPLAGTWHTTLDARENGLAFTPSQEGGSPVITYDLTLNDDGTMRYAMEFQDMITMQGVSVSVVSESEGTWTQEGDTVRMQYPGSARMRVSRITVNGQPFNDESMMAQFNQMLQGEAIEHVFNTVCVKPIDADTLEVTDPKDPASEPMKMTRVK